MIWFIMEWGLYLIQIWDVGRVMMNTRRLVMPTYCLSNGVPLMGKRLPSGTEGCRTKYQHLLSMPERIAPCNYVKVGHAVGYK